MNNIIATFSGKAYDKTTKLLIWSSQTDEASDDVLVFDDRWLCESGYVARNRWLFDVWSPSAVDNPQPVQHGFGWCSWKAFVILSAFDRVKEGDVVMYVDADCYPVAPFGHLFQECVDAEGVLLFDEGVSNARFTKADCMVVMGLPVEDGPHACGRFSLWQKGSFLARQMLAEWWAYSINPRCTLWDESVLVNDPPAYYRNSTEQSVLSNLAIKYKLPLHSPIDGEGTPGQLFRQEWCAGDRSDLSGSSYRNV